MLFNVPVAVGFGEGLGAPAAFLVATIILLIFSVGYAAMASKVTAVGGFYSFISHGLGREIGMGFGFGSVVAYSVFEASLAGGFAYFGNLDLNAWLGINVPWPILALFMVALISILTYFDVKLSSAILGCALIAEVAILTIFAVGIFAKAGSGANVSLAAINPAAAFFGFAANGKLAAGAAGIGLFFAFWSWVGFEMAPNYAEEFRDPKRIVPRVPLHFGAGTGHLLHADLLGRRLGLRQARRHDQPGPEQLRPVLLRSGDQADRRLGRHIDEHLHPDRIVCLRHGLPQHGRAISLFAGTRTRPSCSSRQDAFGASHALYRIVHPDDPGDHHHPAVRHLRRDERSRPPRPISNSMASWHSSVRS